MRKTSPYVVLTRESGKNASFAGRLKMLGFNTLSYPCIVTKSNLSTKKLRTYIDMIEQYDFIIFTSSNGVKFFMKEIRKTDRKILQTISIVTIGAETAKTAERYGLSISYMPAVFTSSELVKVLGEIHSLHILLPRSQIARRELKLRLERKGAFVTDMPVYKTELISKPNKKFMTLLKREALACITFTSPSTVDGLLKSICGYMHKEVFLLPVISIGPVTTAKLREYGFSTIYTADTYTVDGMIDKIKQNIL